MNLETQHPEIYAVSTSIGNVLGFIVGLFIILVLCLYSVGLTLSEGWEQLKSLFRKKI